MSGVTDPYLDASTGILANLVDATTAVDLARAESDLSTARTIQVQDDDLVPPTRDLLELQGLHRHIFQDLFAWAGEIRSIDMRRGAGDFFAPASHIEVNSAHVFSRLHELDHLRGLARDEFLAQITNFYDLLNFIHPFREGNGRTQRLFWSRVSHDAGWLLDWRPIHGSELDETSRIAREDRDLGPLTGALERCISRIEPGSGGPSHARSLEQ